MKSKKTVPAVPVVEVIKVEVENKDVEFLDIRCPDGHLLFKYSLRQGAIQIRSRAGDLLTVPVKDIEATSARNALAEKPAYTYVARMPAPLDL